MKKAFLKISTLILIGCSIMKTTHTMKPESICREDTSTLASITKTLLSQQEISDLLLSYFGESDTIYVAIKMEPYISQIRSNGDKYIAHNDKLIAFFEYRELFFFRIMTWLEYITINIDENHIVAEFQFVVGFKADDVVYKALFECINGEIQLKSLTL